MGWQAVTMAWLSPAPPKSEAGKVPPLAAGWTTLVALLASWDGGCQSPSVHSEGSFP